jgi:hypothetical protein
VIFSWPSRDFSALQWSSSSRMRSSESLARLLAKGLADERIRDTVS